MDLLSRIDTNLFQFAAGSNCNDNTVYLNLSEDPTIRDSKLCECEYSNSMKINNDYISYYFSHNYQVLTLCALNNVFKKVVNIQLPSSSMCKHHTAVIYQNEETIFFDLILQNGIYLKISISIDYLMNYTNTLPSNWYSVFRPYDFTVRNPHLLFRVSEELTIAFLKDGGLLGLKSDSESNNIIDAILFSDSSYFQSITKIFRKHQTATTGKVVDCTIFEQRYLVVLTENCILKIWDIESFNIVNEYNLAAENNFDKLSGGVFDSVGNYIITQDNLVFIYLPFMNGIFQVGTLSTSPTKGCEYTSTTEISSNLPSTSLWSLVDMKFVKVLDLNRYDSFCNIVVLWKSGSISKLQILNFTNSSLDLFEWIESSSSLLEESNINIQSDELTFEEKLLALKSHYSEGIYDHLQNVLQSNEILIPTADEANVEYLENLETLLKDTKRQCNEASSLTIYHDEIIVINCCQKFNHSIYKINSSLENIYFNAEISPGDDDVSKFLKIINQFLSPIPSRLLYKISTEFTNIITMKNSNSSSLGDQLTKIFQNCLQSKVEFADNQNLMEQLKSIDAVSVINSFINNHLEVFVEHSHSFIDSIKENSFSNIIALQSFISLLTIHQKFIVNVLIMFTLLDFDQSLFENQLSKLLAVHYKQQLVMNLYNQNKNRFASELFKQTTKYANGIEIDCYSDLFNYLNYALFELYQTDINKNPYFLRFFNDIVLHNNTSNKIEQNLFLDGVCKPYLIKNNVVHDFLMAMHLLLSNEYQESYNLFVKHDYIEKMKNSLPQILLDITESELDNVWKPFLHSFAFEAGTPYFFYELSLLYMRSDSIEFALKSIKKSLECSISDVELEEETNFRENQLKQYLNLLIDVNLHNEALDVLRLSESTLNETVREEYYKTLLSKTDINGGFLSTLCHLCKDHKGQDLFLNLADIEIIDKLLTKMLRVSAWSSYKALFCFRVSTKRDKEAAQIIYQYSQLVNDDLISQKKCYLIVSNILSSFEETSDQWILYGSEIVTLASVKKSLQNIID